MSESCESEVWAKQKLAKRTEQKGEGKGENNIAERVQYERIKQSTMEGEKRYIIGKMIKGDDILNRTHGKDKCLKDGFGRKVTEE